MILNGLKIFYKGSNPMENEFVLLLFPKEWQELHKIDNLETFDSLEENHFFCLLFSNGEYLFVEENQIVNHISGIPVWPPYGLVKTVSDPNNKEFQEWEKQIVDSFSKQEKLDFSLSLKEEKDISISDIDW